MAVAAGEKTTPASAPSTPTTAIIIVLSLCGTLVSLQQTLVLPLLPDFPEILDTTIYDEIIDINAQRLRHLDEQRSISEVLNEVEDQRGPVPWVRGGMLVAALSLADGKPLSVGQDADGAGEHDLAEHAAPDESDRALDGSGVQAGQEIAIPAQYDR